MTSGVLRSNLLEKWQPTRLDGDHMHMLEMHLAGFSHREIAEHMGCTPQTISNIVTSDLGQAFIQDRINAMDQQFLGLYGKVISTVSEGLDATNDMPVRLQAADKWLKAHGKYARSEGTAPPVSAEEIVERLLKRGSLQPQVNISDSNVVIAREPPRGVEPPVPFREVSETDKECV